MSSVAAALLPESDLVAGTVVDGFRVLRPLGEGAMGQVFLAQDLSLGRRVALKFLKVELLGPRNSERLLEEARTTAKFSHPHIVTVHAVGAWQGRPYLALEFLDGESLRERISRERLAQHEALRVCRAIAEALSEAHRHGVIHADLKPENVLLPRDGRVRVVDFGLARHQGGEEGAASGTPAYMAPERWRGTPPTAAIDVWALGVLACELLEGRRPLDDAQLARLAYATDATSLETGLAEHPAGTLLQACLALDPAQRPSAQDVAEALSQALSANAGRELDRVPFRGLRAFTEADAADYFGREAEIDAFVERLRHEPLVPLVGPSGVGKSSFLHAGVIARLRQSGRWTVIHLRPGASPLLRLATMLVAGLGGEAPAAQLAEKLTNTPGEILRLLRRRASVSNARVLLVIDAFEEVFTLGASDDEVRVISACLAAAASADDQSRIVLGLRDDFLGHFARLAPLRPHLGAAFVLHQLGPAGLEEAIAGPLRRVGYAPDEPSLIARLVSDVQAQPAGLPLLQFACTALWERRDTRGRRLLAAEYDRLGGVGGALASHAQQMLRELPPEEIRCARLMLLRLVSATGTRRPRAQGELLEGLGEVAPRVLERLLGNRLLVLARDPQTDEPFIELAHESLATAWPELARWVEETREDRQLVQQLEQAAQLWEQRGRPESETWSDEALRQALRRVDQTDLALATRSREFLDAGRRRALRRTRRRTLVGTSAFVALALVAVGAAGAAVAFREKQLEAVRQQREIRLASADVGRFDLLFTFHDYDPVTRRWTRAEAPEAPRWSLRPADEDGRYEDAKPYAEGEIVPGAAHRAPEGGWRQRVEAPSRAAWLTVERPGCAASVIRLKRLPGFGERDRQPVAEVPVPVPTCAATRAVQVEIPAGEYLRPIDDAPPMSAFVGGFAIDRTEVTNAEFALFEEEVLPLTSYDRVRAPEEATELLAHALAPDAPVSGVDALAAEAFCRFVGKRLPSIDEWRKAFRGGLVLDEAGTVENPAPARRTVWERGPPGGRTNIAERDPYPGVAPVGSFPEDRSPYGVFDLAGNVAEWTATTGTHSGPLHFAGLRIVAGSRWDAPAAAGHHEISWTNHQPPRRFDFAIGFRCVEDRPASE